MGQVLTESDFASHPLTRCLIRTRGACNTHVYIGIDNRSKNVDVATFKTNYTCPLPDTFDVGLIVCEHSVYKNAKKLLKIGLVSRKSVSEKKNLIPLIPIRGDCW